MMTLSIRLECSVATIDEELFSKVYEVETDLGKSAECTRCMVYVEKSILYENQRPCIGLKGIEILQIVGKSV